VTPEMIRRGIYLARVRKGWSQRETAEACDVWTTQVADWEAGRVKPGLEHLCKLNAVLEMGLRFDGDLLDRLEAEGMLTVTTTQKAA